MTNLPNVQPKNTPLNVPRTSVYGSKRSQAKLAMLDFDPIAELVKNYHKLEAEIEYQEGLRSGEIVEVSSSTGKLRSYYAPTHHSLYDKLITVAEKLLRYSYGRIPEGDEKKVEHAAAFIVNLTKKGEQYVLGGGEEAEDY